jgi:hypothetical protein
MAGREQELMDRIRQLEEQNSALQDKLDMIYAILEPDYEIAGEEPESPISIQQSPIRQGLVRIDGTKPG